jgi:hypothetical protein
VDALEHAYAGGLGHAPRHETLAILCAQVALETANGSACVQWNVGNFKGGCSVDECQFVTTEYEGEPPEPVVQTCTFSAWPDLTAGCQYYVRALYSHWPEAWAGAVAGDARAFAAGLRQRGYYTAPLALYAAGVERWQAYYLARLGGATEPTEPPPGLTPQGAAALATEGLLDPSPPESQTRPDVAQ